MYKLLHSTEITHRNDFGELCNQHGVRDAAEIGVHKGEFAEQFLSKWNGFVLLLVDPYKPYAEMWWDLEPARQLAIKRLARFIDHIEFINIASPEAAKALPAHWRLQFVYIDACHLYEFVKADIEAWWERLDSGGILAGHDFADHQGGPVNLETLQNANHVVDAVLEFAQAHDLPVYITQEVGFPWSWYIYKP